ncbi:enoyl-CoA hydratase/isomerase family protein [Rathayibacter soli]|uniref:enoyl-CoA hydratase/isomerase family protein n=1 Tax=Rathayibacter soli TaxID=3144168 RepID=UPI0027E3EEF5|nr:enoyl-CoA hydratase/isomerase family protein [Glaciibacter superstes]
MTPHKNAAAEVLFTRSGRLGHITLNRPQAINALTHGMVVEIQRVLDEWRDDAGVQTVLLTGAGERGLCAGGDIVSLYRDAVRGDDRAAAQFWADEYRLNASIARYPKPYVAIMDGLVLGGGIGLSAHGSHRVVTERSTLGMPETGIGFVPDVGGTWLLSHAPGELGTFLALTAGTVHAEDAIAIGLADHLVPRERLVELVASLESADATAAIAAVASTPGPGTLAGQRGWIDVAFAGNEAGEILHRLGKQPAAVTGNAASGAAAGAAASAAERIASKSPTALAVTLESLRRARQLDSLEAALDQENRVSLRAFAAHDFAEGVRAQVIDKDRAPHWDPIDIPARTDAAVTAFFEPLGERELGLADARRARRAHGEE